MAEPVNEQVGRQRRARLVIAVLLAVFLAPVVGGWAWFYFGDNFSRKNLGTLYEPARPLEGVTFSAAESATASLADLQGSWLLLYVGEGDCDDDCLGRLDLVSRVRISLGENIKRVMPVYLTDADLGPQAVERIRAAMPTGIIASLDAGGLESLRGQLAHTGEDAGQALHRVYLIDPIGNLVLSYEPGADPLGMRKDLARLLRVSQIG